MLNAHDGLRSRQNDPRFLRVVERGAVHVSTFPISIYGPLLRQQASSDPPSSSCPCPFSLATIPEARLTHEYLKPFDGWRRRRERRLHAGAADLAEQRVLQPHTAYPLCEPDPGKHRSPSNEEKSVPDRAAQLEGDIRFLPERILDDCLRGREPTQTVPDDLNAFTIVALRTLLARASSEGTCGNAEDEMLALLGTECPNELWENRQEVRDRIRMLADEVDEPQSRCRRAGVAVVDPGSSGLVGDSGRSRGITPFVSGLRNMMEVNEDQRWELQGRRARGSSLEEGVEQTAGYYGRYLGAVQTLLPGTPSSSLSASGEQ